MLITRSRRPALAARLLAMLVLAGLGASGASAASVTVRPGETLSAIAARHGVSAAALAAANGIRNPNLVVAGRRLALPGGATATGGGTVTVLRGQTLSAIAARHGVSAAALAALNGIRNPDLVVAGTRMRLPGGATGSTGGAVASGGSVTVRPGDTLSAIAARRGVSPEALAALNGIADPDTIRIGRRLRVPGGTSGAPSYLAPTVTVPRSEVGALISRAAARHGVDAGLARAVAWQESGYSQFMRSHVGAIGVMQLMPYTAEWAGPALLGRRIDPRNVHDNIDAGVAYLAWLQRRTGDRRRTAMAYYQGLASLSERGPYDDTIAYARSVMQLAGRV